MPQEVRGVVSREKGKPGTVETIWTPDPVEVAGSAIAQFARHVTMATGAAFAGYLDLWAWSVEHLEEFWGAVWDFFAVQADGSHAEVLRDPTMPGARWFPGTRLNYAEHALRRGDEAAAADTVAVTAISRVASRDAVDDYDALAQFTTYAGRPHAAISPATPRKQP